MPQNKNFQQRITILDSCFASPTGMYTLDKLQTVISEKLDKHVSRRTLQDDISHILSIIHEDQSNTYDLERFPVFIKGLKDWKKKFFVIPIQIMRWEITYCLKAIKNNYRILYRYYQGTEIAKSFHG